MLTWDSIRNFVMQHVHRVVAVVHRAHLRWAPQLWQLVCNREVSLGPAALSPENTQVRQTKFIILGRTETDLLDQLVGPCVQGTR